MPRTARIVAEGYPHHVTQRGNNKQDVFFVDDDRKRYLDFLGQESEKNGLVIIGYCLMTNHIHLIVKPSATDSLADAIGRTHFRYTQYINKRHARSGHLWQNRFHSCVLDEKHLWSALKYVERNPVRAQIVEKAWDYKWSSAAEHVGITGRIVLPTDDFWQKKKHFINWKEKLEEKDDEKMIAVLKNRTSTGRPLASDSFISKLETKIGRRLRPLPVGRPKKGK